MSIETLNPKMKNLFLFLILLVGVTAFGQTETKYKYNYKQGYRFIQKAYKKLKHQHYNKAEKLLAKASEADYGWCGNAWDDAFGSINLMSVQILIHQQKYDEALSKLDSLGGCSLGADCEMRDSLKITALFFKFGSEKVKAAFTKAKSVNINFDLDKGYDCWVLLPDLNYTFRFDADGSEINSTKTFYELAKDKPFYKLLQ